MGLAGLVWFAVVDRDLAAGSMAAKVLPSDRSLETMYFSPVCADAVIVADPDASWTIPYW